MIDSLKLPDEAATAVVALGIEFETYSDDMPESKKDRLEAAHEMVTYAIDAYKEEDIRSDSDNEDKAEAGEQVEAILKVAGIKIDDDGDIDYGKALTGAKLEKLLGKFDLEMDGAGEEDEEDSGDEAAFDINDIIDGYDDLSPASKIKAIKKLKLDPDDEDDSSKLNDIADYEEDQDKPASRVVSYIEELLGEEDEDSDDDEEEEEDEPVSEQREQYSEKELLKMSKEDLKEVAEELEVDFPKRLTETGRKRTVKAILEAQEDGGESEEDSEEPWEGYDDMSVAKIKRVLKDAAESDDLDEDQIAMVVEYEEANENRSAILKVLEQLGEGDEEDEEEEEKPKASSRRRRRGSSDPDDSDDTEDAVDRDDEKESRRSKRSKTDTSNGNIVLTRDQILTALQEGEVEVPVG